jgi:hypothetical protein
MENDQPTMFRKQMAGQIGWGYLMKCQKGAYQQMTIQDEELGEWISGEVRDLPVQKWGRSLVDSAIIAAGVAIR